MNKKIRLGVPALVLAGLLLSGCGASASTDAGAGTDETVQTLRIASTGTSLSFAPLTAAIALDTFSDHNLAVEHTDFASSSPNALAALTSGEADIAVVGAQNVFDALQAGADLVVIGGATTMASEMGIRSAIAEERGVDGDSSLAKKVEALRGLTIHTTPPGGTTSQTLRLILEMNGLNPDTDVTIVPSEGTRIIAGLSDGTVDAAFWATGVMDTNYLEGSAIPYISLPQGDVPELKDSLFVVHVTTKKFLDDNPEAVDAYLAAIQDAGAQMGGEALTEVRQAYFPDMDESLFNSAWSNVQSAWIKDASLTREQWESSLELQAELTGKDYSNLDYDTQMRVASAANAAAEKSSQ